MGVRSGLSVKLTSRNTGQRITVGDGPEKRSVIPGGIERRNGGTLKEGKAGSTFDKNVHPHTEGKTEHIEQEKIGGE